MPVYFSASYFHAFEQAEHLRLADVLFAVTATLQAGLGGASGTPADTAISQTALVPATAQSLQFKAYAPGFLSPIVPLFVTLGGQRLSLTPLASAANYTLYGADIHTLAGMVLNLTLYEIA